ncbi:MAG TPA: S8 family peptidase [Oscillatoriaceae cyanobacterium]
MAWRNGFLVGGTVGLLLLQGCGNHGLMTASGSVAPQILSVSQTPRATEVAGRAVVRFESGTSDGAMRSFTQRYHLTALRAVNSLGIGVMNLPATKSTSALLGAMQSDPDVAYVEPDYLFTLPPVVHRTQTAARRVMDVQSAVDPDLSQQWGLLKIDAQQAWNFNSGSANVVVAVVDTGVDISHPDLAANLVPGVSVLPNSTGPEDDHGHGTHVAGIIAAALNNGQGGSGVAPHCKIMPVKVLNKDGKGDTGDIVSGIMYAVDNGASVINLSLGGTGGSRALKDAIDYALSKNVVVVAAMGNDGLNSEDYPAGYDGVIAVGAVDEQDHVADFSNFGSWISVVAPGVDILSTLPHYEVTVEDLEGKSPSYDMMDGTSMATPFVSGVAALVRSQFPGLSAAAVKARIEKTADDLGAPGFDPYYGHGRVNAYRALLGS